MVKMENLFKTKGNAKINQSLYYLTIYVMNTYF